MNNIIGSQRDATKERQSRLNGNKLEPKREAEQGRCKKNIASHNDSVTEMNWSYLCVCYCYEKCCGC